MNLVYLLLIPENLQLCQEDLHTSCQQRAADICAALVILTIPEHLRIGERDDDHIKSDDFKSYNWIDLKAFLLYIKGHLRSH